MIAFAKKKQILFFLICNALLLLGGMVIGAYVFGPRNEELLLRRANGEMAVIALLLGRLPLPNATGQHEFLLRDLSQIEGVYGSPGFRTFLQQGTQRRMLRIVSGALVDPWGGRYVILVNAGGEKVLTFHPTAAPDDSLTINGCDVVVILQSRGVIWKGVAAPAHRSGM